MLLLLLLLPKRGLFFVFFNACSVEKKERAEVLITHVDVGDENETVRVDGRDKNAIRGFLPNIPFTVLCHKEV